MSPFLLPGAFYEISESGGYAKSAAGRLAESDIDVWLVDQRRTGLAPGACESGSADCSVIGTWDFNAYSSDGLFALSLVKGTHPRKKPVIGGFSAGSNAALATLNRAPQEFSGLFLYEGTFFTEDPVIIAHNDTICTNLEGALAAGSVFDPSAAVYGLVVRSATADPNGIFPLPVFPPGTTNQQALLYVFAAPPPPGALAPTPSFVRTIADFSTQQFVYTNQARLGLTGSLFDNYGSLAAVRDLSCGLAGRDDQHFDHVGAFHGDVLLFIEGTGFGPALFDTAGLFDHAASVTIDHNPELGEADPYFHRRWEQVFLKPLRSWLRRPL
jgi:pimeloyl-ACP methyl ester carboxylesterase